MPQLPHPRKKKARKAGPALPPPRASLRFLVRLAPRDVAMFRFLLEAYDNLAYFTVLDAGEALLSLVCSPHQKDAVRQALEGIGERLPLRCDPWPLERHAAIPLQEAGAGSKP